jgi:3-phenylpropionate/trans-cinnamate dioxygenase ferredoxin subunit
VPRAFVPLAAAADIPPGEVRVFETDYERIAVCNVDGAFYAIADLCTHDDGPLGEGTLDGCAILCPRHGALFDVRDGAVLRAPAVTPVPTYPLKVEGGRILVELETEAE